MLLFDCLNANLFSKITEVIIKKCNNSFHSGVKLLNLLRLIITAQVSLNKDEFTLFYQVYNPHILHKLQFESI